MSASRRRLVVLGMMTKIPVAGVVWQTLHYLLGFKRLGFDVVYVESHARTPSMLMRHEADDSGALAAGFIDRTLRRFDLSDRWAYVALHDDGRQYGLSKAELAGAYGSAELIVNLHGGTEPLPAHSATGRLVYLETDPVQLQVELHNGLRSTIDFLEQHCAFFTFGEAYGTPGCGLPTTDRFRFLPTRQPVVLDLWGPRNGPGSGAFTTIGNWRQQWRDITFAGETYRWTKDLEFERMLDLPARTGRDFELALASCEEADRVRLVDNGWRVRDAAPLSDDIDAYRDYIAGSTAEFTVAKDQNVRLRSGWFSDRSATYLASGRPVATQDTGFGVALPTGRGLHAFSTIDDAAAAVELVTGEYAGEHAAALQIAREYFDSSVVLRRLLEDVGVSPRSGGVSMAVPGDIDLVPVSRRPLRLATRTLSSVCERPVPFPQRQTAEPQTTIVLVTRDNLAVTRLCIESVLADADAPAYELVVVDNASTDGTRSYLLTLGRRSPGVQLLLNDTNEGFPRACNAGLSRARGQTLVLLNNDTIVTAGWLRRLCSHVRKSDAGLVGAVTNRIGNEAEVPCDYRTIDELERFAAARADERLGHAFEIPMPAMFCVAMRRETWERLGPLDERFEIGTLEDDDYALRSRHAGYRNLCAEDVFVHHFGEASFGELYASGEHSRLLADNKRRYAEKWGCEWLPYGSHDRGDYDELIERVRYTLSTALPEGSDVIVVSRGDEALVHLDQRTAMHFPQDSDGVYAGHYPATSDEAIAQLEALRRRGGSYFVLPRTGYWWLDHYAGLREHLETQYTRVVNDDACVVYALDGMETDR
jgi:GT2 family glycosyltransferase